MPRLADTGSHRPGVKSCRRLPHGEPVLQIVGQVAAPQRPPVVAGGDPLGDLAQLGARQLVAKFRLADQNDLQQLAAAGFQVGQQPQLFKDLAGEILRLVDDENRRQPAGVGIEQEPVQGIDEGLVADIALRVDDTELVADRRQQFGDAQGRLSTSATCTCPAPVRGGSGRSSFCRYPPPRSAARTPIPQPVEQMRQRLAVAPLRW
jgi:hypothetical protein